MAKQQVSIGGIENALQYDDADVTYGLTVTGRARVQTSPSADTDIARKIDLLTAGLSIHEGCLDGRAGQFSMPTSGVLEVVPDPPLKYTFKETTNAKTGFAFGALNTTSMGLYVSELGDWHVKVTAQSIPAAPTAFSFIMLQKDLLAGCQPCWSRNTWHTALNTLGYGSACAPFESIPATLPFGGWDPGGACILGSSLYCIPGGVDATSNPRYGSLFEYSPDTDSWAIRARLPIQYAPLGNTSRINAFHHLVGVGGKVYYFGGENTLNSATIDKKVYSWAPGDTTWTLESFSLPTRRTRGTVVHFQGDAYIIGGHKRSQRGLKSVLKFNGSSFVQVATMPSFCYNGAAAVVNSEIIYMGGQGGNTSTAAGSLRSVYRSTGSTFTALSTVLPGNVFDDGWASSEGNQAMYGHISAAGIWYRFDGHNFFDYPKLHGLPQYGGLNCVLGFGGLIYLFGWGPARYSQWVYVPFEGNPINPFTGQAAY